MLLITVWIAYKFVNQHIQFYLSSKQKQWNLLLHTNLHKISTNLWQRNLSILQLKNMPITEWDWKQGSNLETSRIVYCVSFCSQLKSVYCVFVSAYCITGLCIMIRKEFTMIRNVKTNLLQILVSIHKWIELNWVPNVKVIALDNSSIIWTLFVLSFLSQLQMRPSGVKA